MAATNGPDGAGKRKRSKKNKKRTVEVEVSSSDSESNNQQPESSAVKEGENEKSSSAVKQTEDIAMTDADTPTRASRSKSPPNERQDFSAIYLRTVTTDLADDLDKVREAKDFKSSSLPMLIHALKQGESIYNAEEKRRVVSAANA